MTQFCREDLRQSFDEKKARQIAQRLFVQCPSTQMVIRKKYELRGKPITAIINVCAYNVKDVIEEANRILERKHQNAKLELWEEILEFAIKFRERV